MRVKRIPPFEKGDPADAWYADAHDEESHDGWEQSIPLEREGFPFDTRSKGNTFWYCYI